MSTRLATENDLMSITKLLIEMKENTLVVVSKYELRHVVNSKDHAVILAVNDRDEPEGMVILNIVYKLLKRECRVDEVVVSTAARGKGFGTELMRSCEEWALQNNASVIELTSRPTREAANRLYQKLGYIQRDTNVYHKQLGE